MFRRRSRRARLSRAAGIRLLIFAGLAVAFSVFFLAITVWKELDAGP